MAGLWIASEEVNAPLERGATAQNRAGFAGGSNS